MEKTKRRKEPPALTQAVEEELAVRRGDPTTPHAPETGDGRGIALFTPELQEDMLDRIQAGEYLIRICDNLKMPNVKAVNYYMDTHPEYKKRYDVACKMRAELMADSIVQDALDARDMDYLGIQAQRLIIDTKKWVIVKLLPKYADKIVHAGDQDAPLVTKILVESDELLKKIRGE